MHVVATCANLAMCSYAETRYCAFRLMCTYGAVLSVAMGHLGELNINVRESHSWCVLDVYHSTYIRHLLSCKCRWYSHCTNEDIYSKVHFTKQLPSDSEK